ncbi:MAG: hypothetical protein ABI298_08235 [Acidimicrobiales bacterium]
MRKLLVALAAVVVVAAVVFVAADQHSAPSVPTLKSHVIRPNALYRSALKSTFLVYKLHNKEMATTDKITWGQVKDAGPRQPLLAYDAVDHRDWALAAFNLVLPSSYKAGVSFQDGGNMGIFYRIGSGKWIMTGSPGFPLCAGDVPTPVARLWRIENYPACN